MEIRQTPDPYIIPYDADLHANDEIAICSGSFEGRYEGVVALGLGYAHLLNGLSLSILSESCWDVALINLTCLELHPETNEDLFQSPVNNFIEPSGGDRMAMTS